MKDKSTSKKSSGKAAKQKAPNTSSGSTIRSDEFSDIPEIIRQRSHLEAALLASQQNAQPAVLPVARHHPPRRDPARAVQPVADVDELIDTVSSVMQRVDDVMQLERCLDGIMRLRAAPPKDFEKRSAALHKEVTKRFEKYENTYDLLTNIGFMSLVGRWLEIPCHSIVGGAIGMKCVIGFSAPAAQKPIA